MAERRSGTGAPATGFGARPPAPVRCSASGARSRGSKGGAASPLPGRSVQHCVGWLTTTNGREPAPADAPKTRSRAPPETGGGGAIAGKLLGLLAAGLTDGAGDPALSARVAAFRPTPYPSETRDCRSEAILRPVVSPKRRWNAPKRPPSPVGPERPRMVAMAAYRCVT